MGSRVLSIGISPQERSRLCVAASEDLCQQAAHYVRSAAQVASCDAAAEPYVRAVYVYQTSTVTAERVSLASGEECGSHLRNTLRACVAGVTVPCVACWVTVVLEDTCIVQHAVFAIAANSAKTVNWTSPVAMRPDGSPNQRGGVRWSTSARPAPVLSVPDGHVSTPLEEHLAPEEENEKEEDIGVAAADVPLSNEIEEQQAEAEEESDEEEEADAAEVPPPPPPPPVSHREVPPPQQQQQRLAPAGATRQPASVNPQRMATTPCAHSARSLAKAMASLNPQQAPASAPQPQTPPPEPQEADDYTEDDEAPQYAQAPPQHESYPCSSAQSSTAPKRTTARPPPPTANACDEKPGWNRTSAVPELAQRRAPQPPSSESLRERYAAPASSGYAPSESGSAAAMPRRAAPQQRTAASSVADSQRSRPASSSSSRRAPNGLVVYDSPQAELVVPSNGRQWGDLAYRTRYSPRREELWDIANAVMTHNYDQPMIAAGVEPAYIEDYYEDEEPEM